MKRRDVQCPACREIFSVRKPTWCHCTGSPTKCTSVANQQKIANVTGQDRPLTPTHTTTE
jgi:hypothetical protein